MTTFVTDARPADLRDAAGVEWRVATPECSVRFGVWQGALIGIEKLKRRVHAVHVKDEATRDALLSFMPGFRVWGNEAWERKHNAPVPHIAGEPFPERVHGKRGQRVKSDGTIEDMTDGEADTELAAAEEQPE